MLKRLTFIYFKIQNYIKYGFRYLKNENLI